MSKKSLKTKIHEYIQKQYRWVHGGDLEVFAQKEGYKAGTGNRRARELAEEGKIKRKTNEKGHVMYRRKERKPEQLTIPVFTV